MILMCISILHRSIDFRPNRRETVAIKHFSKTVLCLRPMDKFLAAFYPTPPYDFNLNASASRYYTTLGMWRDGCYWRALRAGQGIALVKIANRGSIDSPALDVWLVD